MKISNTLVASKQNLIEKHHRLMKNLYFVFILLFFTSNERFSHFNIQQLLSDISHYVLFSQAHLKITLKMKKFEKIYFIRFYWISNTKVRFILFKFFWSKTWKSNPTSKPKLCDTPKPKKERTKKSPYNLHEIFFNKFQNGERSINTCLQICHQLLMESI